jgi:hypothetical protein
MKISTRYKIKKTSWAGKSLFRNVQVHPLHLLLTPPNHHLKHPRLNRIPHIPPPNPQLLPINPKRHRLRLPHPQMHPSEILQLLHRPGHTTHLLMYIKLNNLIPRHTPYIRHINSHRHRPIRRHRSSRQPRRRILILRIRKPKPKMIQRRVSLRHIRQKLRTGLMVIVNRYLSHRPWNADRQLPRRIHITKKYSRCRIPRLFTSKPPVQDRPGMFRDIIHRKWPSVRQIDNHRLAGSHQGLHQFILIRRQVQVVTSP